jgi:hypothetical protein
MPYPRIIPNDSSLLKREAPAFSVIVSFPALMKSGSACPRFGKGPYNQDDDIHESHFKPYHILENAFFSLTKPNIPFSLWR